MDIHEFAKSVGLFETADEHNSKTFQRQQKRIGINDCAYITNLKATGKMVISFSNHIFTANYPVSTYAFSRASYSR